jgi:hypothetical protein
MYILHIGVPQLLEPPAAAAGHHSGQKTAVHIEVF